MLSSYTKGLIAESLIKFFLRLCFFRILETRFKIKLGEIDLIAKRNNLLLFVEVKFRSKEKDLDGVLTKRQIARIVRAAELFTMRNTSLSNLKQRVDLIYIAKPMKIKWIKNITF